MLVHRRVTPQREQHLLAVTTGFEPATYGFQIRPALTTRPRCLPLSVPKRDLDTKETTPNMEVCPESLGAMLYDICYMMYRTWTIIYKTALTYNLAQSVCFP